MSSKARSNQLRLHIAQEAARIMAESYSRNFQAAKRKAALQLGLSDMRHLPSNLEVERALAAYQRLFRSDEQPRHLRQLREAAVSAMRFLHPFSPRLVGPVLEGTADEHSEVNLHLFADSAEEVGLFLMEHRVPWDLAERRTRSVTGTYESRPEYRFLADQVAMAVTVFAGRGGRHAPLSPVDGRPMRRANLAEVEALLGDAQEP